MNIERLEMMKQMMGRVVAGSWSPVNSLPAKERFIGEVTKVKVSSVVLSSWSNHKSGQIGGTCGFTACSVGHACFDEEFRKLGLKFDGSQPMFSGWRGWPAVEAFFGIRDDTAENLFMSNKYHLAVRNKYAHLPVNVREAQMVHDRVDMLIRSSNEHTFNATVRTL